MQKQTSRRRGVAYIVVRSVLAKTIWQEVNYAITRLTTQTLRTGHCTMIESQLLGIDNGAALLGFVYLVGLTYYFIRR